MKKPQRNLRDPVAPWPNGNLYYVRDPNWSPVMMGNRCQFVSRDGSVPLEFANYDSMNAFVAILSSPLDGDDLLTAIRARGLDTEDVGNKIRELIRAGVVIEGSEADAYESFRGFVSFEAADHVKPCRNLVFAITGSSQAPTVVPHLYSLLSNFTDSIDVILTKSASRLLNPYPFRIRGLRVWSSMHDSHPGIIVPHVHLARTADLVVVLPATANCIARIANGSCSDLLSLVVAGTRAPVVLFPAMNQMILESPAVARNLRTLVADGRRVIFPAPAVPAAELLDEVPRIAYGSVGVRPDLAGDLAPILAAVLEGSTPPSPKRSAKKKRSGA